MVSWCDERPPRRRIDVSVEENSSFESLGTPSPDLVRDTTYTRTRSFVSNCLGGAPWTIALQCRRRRRIRLRVDWQTVVAKQRQSNAVAPETRSSIGDACLLARAPENSIIRWTASSKWPKMATSVASPMLFPSECAKDQIMNARFIAPLSLIVFAVAVWVGCSSGVLAPQSSVEPGGADARTTKKTHGHAKPDAMASPTIKHVFVIIQENRGLNDLFMGFAGANTATSGQESDGTVVQLTAVPLENSQDIEHNWSDAQAALNPVASGAYQMNGFNNELLLPQGTPAKKFPYAYVPQSETGPYWAIAESWVLADNFSPTELGPSFTAHLNLIAGTDEIAPRQAEANNPSSTNDDWGCNSAPQNLKTDTVQPMQTPILNGPFPCFTQFHTMADLLDNASIPWRFYATSLHFPASRWSAFDAISNIRNGPDWNNDVITPPKQILTDIPAGSLNKVGVVWVVPDEKNSDHAGSDSNTGPSWVASVVNAIGTSNLWKSSVIVVLWDDWGGWYDGVAPPQLDFRGLGIRTPMLILSPYAKQGQDSGHVSHRQFEPGSILRFIETVFNLPSLGSLGGSGYTDQRAVGIDVTLDFAQSPRPFATISAAYPSSYFASQAASMLTPDNQ